MSFLDGKKSSQENAHTQAEICFIFFMPYPKIWSSQTEVFLSIFDLHKNSAKKVFPKLFVNLRNSPHTQSPVEVKPEFKSKCI